MIKFKNEDHKRNYEKHVARCPYDDCWNRSLIYTLTMNKDLVAHIDEIYDFKKGLVKSDCIHAPWQTDGSSRLTRLAFQLYTNNAPTAISYDENDNEIVDSNEFQNYLIVEMLWPMRGDWEYVLEAIKIALEVDLLRSWN